jgi:hypothetical protein
VVGSRAAWWLPKNLDRCLSIARSPLALSLKVRPSKEPEYLMVKVYITFVAIGSDFLKKVLTIAKVIDN